MLIYTIFKTRYGFVGVAATSAGLSRLILPQGSKSSILSSIKNGFEGRRDDEYFKSLRDELTSYFQGRRCLFDYPLDLEKATSYQKKIWEVTRSIPWGETHSYKWVAERIGCPVSYRAVGQALKRNPLPIIIPCHRVIGFNGSLSGFSGGIIWKERLLEIERVGNNCHA
ncbi:MAG: methylated-DNA--[protein]-cysteine S-methyltransferase [bacterium]|nr:methylated-DNA--[protein]-cysteine S-methyltransferase [bacterium]